MKILVLCEKDAINLRLAKIISKLLERGHGVEIYGTSLEEHNIRMFKGLVNSVNLIENLSDEIVSMCDIIFCANDTVGYVNKYKKFIFTYNCASSMGTALSEGGDFMFLPNDMQYVNAKVLCASMVVGDPQFEKNSIASAEDSEKNILFIDCGHYPFGREGKNTLAKLIIDICRRYPEYTIKIKPRFLESDTTGRTHYNRLHLYECIRNIAENNIPDNLQMLNYHEEMDVLMNWAGLVICSYTSAYADAIARNKKLLVISGLPNEDSVNLNNRFTWKTEHDVIQRTGCLVDYKEIFDYLPEGRYCNPEEKIRIVPYVEGAAERVVEVMEYVWNCILANKKIPERKRYQYSDYKQEIQTHSSTCEWDEVLMYRTRNLLVYSGTRYLDAIPHPFDIKHYVSWVDALCDKKNPMPYYELEPINSHYVQYMIINEGESMMETPVNQGYLMEAYFVTGRFGEFEERFMKKLKCMRAYYCYKGRYELAKSNYRIAESYLNEYIVNHGNFEWEEYITDFLWEKQIAINARRKIFPFSYVEEGSKVILYGAGQYGKLYWEQAKEYCDIICFLDKAAKERFCHSVKVIEPQEIADLQYDKIVVCMEDEGVGNQVVQNLLNMEIQSDKIIYR